MFSKVLRRTHMYLALFLTPWVLMYALSTMAMNHREAFRRSYGEAPPAFLKERETTFNGVLPPGTPKEQAAVILASLGLDGAYSANLRKGSGGEIVINRFDAIAPRRITYTPATGALLVEKQVFRPNAWLERMHRRRGLLHPFAADTIWSGTVDLVIAAMLFWGLSGIWLWWEMKATRGWGVLAVSSGVLLFALYLFTL